MQHIELPHGGRYAVTCGGSRRSYVSDVSERRSISADGRDTLRVSVLRALLTEAIPRLGHVRIR